MPQAMALDLATIATAERVARDIDVATAFMLDAEATLDMSAGEALSDIGRLLIQASFESVTISLRSSHTPLTRDVETLAALVRQTLNVERWPRIAVTRTVNRLAKRTP